MTISIDLDEKQIDKEKKKFFKRSHKKKNIEDNDSLIKDIKIKKKTKWGKIITITTVVIIVSILGFGIYKILKASGDIGFKLNPGDIISKEDPILKKDSTGKYTSFLIVGIDTRENGGGLNTDTLVVATFNYETNDVTMISVPRDFYVETLTTENWYKKINSIYSEGEGIKKGSGLKYLEETIEELTNIEIQYYAMVNFNAFVEIIDSLDGVLVNVEEGFTDTCYPSEQGISGSYYAHCVDSWGYWKTISFPIGVQRMDGETALEYARSRHSSNDYERAERQQQVINAVIDSISQSDTYTNPQKILDLISAVSKNITISEFTIDDINAGIDLLKTFNENNGKTYSFVLEPAAGNSQLVVSSNIESSHQEPKLGLGNYTDIHDYISKVLSNPSFYEENSSIYVYDTGLGYQETYNKVLELIEEYPYSNIQFMGTLYSDKEGITIYEYQSGAKPATILELSTHLKTINTTKPEYIANNLNGGDVTVLFGETIINEETTGNE